MGWLRRRRRPEYAGRHRTRAWTEVALPPPAIPEEDSGPASFLERHTAIPARRVDVSSQRPGPLARERQHVRLGFADGTSLDVEDDSAESAELRRLAAILINEPS